MDIEQCISELRLNSQKEYEDSLPVLRNYRDILAGEIKTHPGNIRAASLLAMVDFELRGSTHVSISCLKQAYRMNRQGLSGAEYAQLATNMAYFYIQEYQYTGKAVCSLLKKAIQANPPYPETYFALALLYYQNKHYKLALPFFKRACETSDAFRYGFDYACCLYQCGFAQDAIGILSKLSVHWQSDAPSARAYFVSGIISASLNRFDATGKVAADLLSIDYGAVDVDEYDIAHLMFLAGNYEQCVMLYEKADYAESADWLGEFFFGLKTLNRIKQAKAKLHDIILETDANITDCQNEASEWEPKELAARISFLNQKKAEIRECYDTVFVKNLRPEGHFIVPLFYGCYYIECPRHFTRGGRAASRTIQSEGA